MAALMEKRKIPDNMQPWTCEVNGVKYVYEAGTEQYVPEEVAHIIDAYWKSMEPVMGGSGGVGGLKMLYTWDNDPYLYKSPEFIGENMVSVDELHEYAQSGIVVFSNYELAYFYPTFISLDIDFGVVGFNNGRVLYSKEYVDAPPV